MIRKVKQEKYQTFIEANKGNPGSIYKLFQEVGAGKGSRRQSGISSVNTDEKTVTEDPSEIANAFNDFFVKIKEPINPSNHDKLKDFCKSKISQDTTFAIPAVEKEKVLKYLSNMDISKATGTDSIGARSLKLAAPCTAEDITFIWAAPSEVVTYRLCEQRRFRRACASAQSRQNLRCSLIQTVSQEEPSDRKPDPWPLWMAGHAQLKYVMTECSKTQIRLTRLICNNSNSSSCFPEKWKVAKVSPLLKK